VSFSEWGPSWRHPSPSSRLVGWDRRSGRRCGVRESGASRL